MLFGERTMIAKHILRAIHEMGLLAGMDTENLAPNEITRSHHGFHRPDHSRRLGIPLSPSEARGQRDDGQNSFRMTHRGSSRFREETTQMSNSQSTVIRIRRFCWSVVFQASACGHTG